MTIKFSPCALSDFKKILDGLKDEKGASMLALHKAQDTFGYIPKEIYELISTQLKISLSELDSIISFYNRFSLVPPGDIKIDVCMGTACFVKGSNQHFETLKKAFNIEENGVSKDGKFSLGCSRCVGSCSLAPVIIIDDKVHANVTKEGLTKIISDLQGID